MMMTGDAYKGEQCLKIGLATVLAEDGKLAETTYALAAKLAAKCSERLKSRPWNTRSKGAFFSPEPS